MSKRDLQAYLKELTKEQLEEQVLDLYSRFKQVKTYYNFVFSPKEDKLLEDARFKIGKEYFPVNGRKPKTRRSVAQKIIKHFIQLGVDPYVTSEIMLFNIEVAQQFAQEKTINQEAFYKSMLKSFNEAIQYCSEMGIAKDFQHRFDKIALNAKEMQWMNATGFELALSSNH